MKTWIVESIDCGALKVWKELMLMTLTDTQLARFSRWYAHFPVKKARADAQKAWGQIDPDDALTDWMIIAIENQIAERSRKLARNIWVPEWKLPATWIRKECWDDEVQLELDELESQSDTLIFGGKTYRRKQYV